MLNNFLKNLFHNKLQSFLILLLSISSFSFLLTGCSGGTSGDINSSQPSKVIILPMTKAVALGGTLDFTASGGSEPYSFDVYYGEGSVVNSGGAGAYQAPLSQGTAVVRVQDSQGNTGYATVEITEAPLIQPSLKTLAVENKFPFGAVNGKAPYTFSLVSGDGSVNSATGEFTAGSTSSTVVIRVTDADGRTSDATITVNAALSFAANNIYVEKGTTYSLSASGGVAPYKFFMASGAGQVDASSGVFTASDTLGSSAVKVIDSLGNFDLAIVNTTTALGINPSNALVTKNGSLLFSAVGGVPPYSYSVVAGGGGSIGSSTGQYVAPNFTTTDTVRVTDALNHTSDATVTVTNNLSFSVATVILAVGNSIEVSTLVSGGIAPLTYTAAISHGIFAGSTYTAPNTPGIYTITVYDSTSPTPNQVTAAVLVNASLSLLPGTASMAVSTQKSFSASGGVPPYTYSVQSGGGSISTSGMYTAPSSSGSVVLSVTDARNNTATATVTIQDALTIVPTTKTLSSGEGFTFTASGGSSPYLFSLVSGSGSINSSSGLYTAPGSAGMATVRVEDALGNRKDALITILNPLNISPPSISLIKNGSITFTASGGAGPYTFSVASGDGAINATSGLFVASSTAGTSTVRVTDSLGSIKDATVTVYEGLNISPFTKNLAVNQTFTFTANGGVSPYTYSLISGVGSVSNSGAYSSGTAGSAIVRVTDSQNNTSEATVSVNSALAITPTTKTLGVNNSFTFNATGGVPPYAYSVLSGTGTVTATGDYKAPATNTTAVVRVIDSVNSTADATVTVNDPLILSPTTATLAAGGTQVFIAAGGVSPYVYSVTSGGGSFSTSTYTAPSVASGASVVILVTDVLGNTANATVTINPITVTIASPNSSDLIIASNKAAFPVSGTCSESGRAVTVAATGGVTATPNCSGGTWSTTLNLTSVADGNVTLTANHSNVNSVAATPATVTLSKDGSNPTLSLTAPTASSYVGNSVTISGACTKSGPVNFTVTGGITGITACNGTSFSTTLDITSAPEGAITIGATHTDLAGNSTTPVSVSVTKDSVAPVISAFAVTNSSPTNSTTYNLTSTVVEANSVTHYCILENSTVVANCSWQSGVLPSSFTVSSTNNAKVLTAWSKDAAGNVSTGANSNAVTLDNAAPPAPTSLSLSSPSASPGTDTTPTLLVSGVVSGDSVKIYSDSNCSTEKGTATASGTTVTVTSSALGAGSYAFYANRTSSIGNTSDCSSASVAYVVDLTAPTVSNITSSTANGSYGVSASLSVQVVFSEVVVVSGTPVLYLNMGQGATASVASYVSGSNSNTLTFTYTVATGDNSSDLDYSATNSLSLAGGTIADQAGNAQATPTLPTPGAAGSLAANKNIVINTTPGAAPSGLTLVTPSTSPSTNQTPVISVSGVSSGDVVKLFTDSSCATTAKATGTASATSLQLTSSSLSEGSYTFYANRTDTVGNISNCSSASLAYAVDLTAPAVSNVTSSTSNGSYKAGGSISIQIVFNEVVTVTGTPQLSMLTGRAGSVANYSTGSGSNTLTFAYTVMSGDNSADLDYSSTGALDLAGGSIWDVAGNALLVPLLPSPGASGSLSSNKNIVLDTIAPTAPSGLALSTPSTSPNNVTTPVIQVSGVVSGDTIKLFSDSSCTSEQASGTATGTTILLTSTTLTAGTYNFYANSTDSVGNVSSCSSATVAYQLDTTAATITNVTASGNGPFKAGDTFTISLSLSKAVNVTGAPTLDLSTGRIGAQASYTSGSGSSTLVLSYTVVSTDTSTDLTYTATNSLTLAGGTINDAAGNNATLTLPTIGGAGSLSANQNIVIDTTAPTAPSNLVDGVWISSTSTSPSITFTAGTDSGTGILKHQIQVVLGSNTATVIQTWADFTSGSTVSGLTLSDATQYKVQVKAIDNIGNESSIVTSDGWTIDTTAPTAPTGLTLGSVPNSVTTTPALSWTASSDGGSGVSYYQAQVYKQSDNTTVGALTTLSSGSAISGLSLSDGVQYYFKVKAVDTAGNSTVSGASSSWTVNNDPCTGTPTLGMTCAGGGIYAATYNGVKYMVTPGNCTNSATPTCDGTADTLALPWADGTGGSPAPSLSTSATDGATNTTALVAYSDTLAAKYCSDMIYGGYSDWFLPAPGELDAIQANRASVPGFNTAGGIWYLTSDEWNAGNVKVVQFNSDTGVDSWGGKGTSYYVRCVRTFL